MTPRSNEGAQEAHTLQDPAAVQHTSILAAGDGRDDSIPGANHHISDTLRAELQASALSDEQIGLLPYRSITADQAKAMTGHAHAGWVVPCIGPTGQAFTTSKGEPFYRLKPSTPPVKNGKATRYLSPAGEGCRPYFSLLWPDWLKLGRDRDITEGEKKADSACGHGFPTIGLSGVDGWRDQRSGKSALLPELGGWLEGTVRIAWDSDIVHKPAVQASSNALAEAIAIAGGTPLITLLPPELDGSKNGIDDFIARHGAQAYKVLRSYARPAGDVECDEDSKPIGLKWTWTTEPSGSEATHTKAVMAWSVLKDEVQLLPLGAYRWTGTHWHRQEKDKPADYVARLLHTWMDQIQWKKRTGAAFSSVLSELKSRLESPEGVTWDPPHLMAFSNGTLNTRTNTFTPGHRRSDRLTRCLPYPYDPDATCPSWLAFIEEASGADQHLIITLRAAMRWTIEPKQDRDYPIEVQIDLEGGKGRGKGTVLSGVVALCGGSANIAAIKSSSFSNQNALLKMLNKAASIDFDASGFIKDSGVLNSIVSNEVVEVKALFLNVAQARLNTVVWRAMNDRPGQASAAAEGADRRVIVIPFDITPERKDPDLKAKIETEAAGIFQWVWRMAMEEASYALRHASDSGRIRNAQVDAALGRHPVLRFLHERFLWEGCDEIESSALFQDFRKWLEEGKEDVLPHGKELTSNKFGREMGKLVSSGQQRRPLVDRHGTSFERIRTSGLNPGRIAYRIPELGSWPIANFLMGRSPEAPAGPAAAAGESKASETGSVLQDPSARNPRPPLNPEPSEPFEPLGEKVSIGSTDKGLPPASPLMEAMGLKKVQILQALQAPSSASDLKAEPSGGSEPFASAPPQNDTGGSGVLTQGIGLSPMAPTASNLDMNPSRPELDANAVRSNLTALKPGDRVHIAHQRLPFGRLHAAKVVKVVNANVQFTPAIEGLFDDPSDPAAGPWNPPAPLQSSSSSKCLPELGDRSQASIDSFEREGATWRRLRYVRTHGDGTTSEVTREIPPPAVRWEPLDEGGLDAFLAEVNQQTTLITQELEQLRRGR
jgi:phage/plasmid-associated DNA primase